MANTLLIHKVGTKKFWHRHNDDPLTDFAISDFYYSIDGNRFKIVEKDGARRFEYLVSNISIKDGSGAVETGFTPTTLLNRFVSLGYVPFENVVVGGLTTDEIDAIHVANSPTLVNPFQTENDINNVVYNLEINQADLSGTGTTEEQICEYILALPEADRTILKTQSKWNVVLTETAYTRIHSAVFSSEFN